jgi:L-threonylcarbamoyladenylate synthase
MQKPLVSTSANISGEAPPRNFAEITPAIKNGVDYIVNHRREEKENPPSSRIIKIKEDGSFIVLR